MIKGKYSTEQFNGTLEELDRFLDSQMNKGWDIYNVQFIRDVDGISGRKIFYVYMRWLSDGR